MLNPELSKIIVISIIYAKNWYLSEIIVIFNNAHDKNWTKVSKIRWF